MACLHERIKQILQCIIRKALGRIILLTKGRLQLYSFNEVTTVHGQFCAMVDVENVRQNSSPNPLPPSH